MTNAEFQVKVDQYNDLVAQERALLTELFTEFYNRPGYKHVRFSNNSVWSVGMCGDCTNPANLERFVLPRILSDQTETITGFTLAEE